MLHGIIVPSAMIILVLFGIIFIIGGLYKRAERDAAFVRTGLGGKMVIMDGGAMVLPVFHSLSKVQLNTLLLTVSRGEKEALITMDRMRADIGAEFYVRVKPDEEAIALAAQTLGDRTNDANELRKLIEAKLVDALRSVAARMTLTQLQEQRTEFVRAVQDAVAADLQSNGLELESVSLTKLDQTDKRHFNPDNTFDAEGLAALTRITETRRKEVNDVTRETEVAIAQRDRDARRQQLEIEREVQDAQLNQQRDIAQKTSATRAEVAAKESEARQAEEEARITAEQVVAEREAKAREARESAQVFADRAIRQRKIEADRDVEIAEQERQIMIANKSREESVARAEAEDARAKAVTSEEKVVTARETEIAEREKAIAIIAARRVAETEATAVTVRADAEMQAAGDQAGAIRTLAEANADAAKIEADGILARGQAVAAAEAAMNEARNALDSKVIEYELTRDRIRIIPEALAEAVRPIEKIESIRIFSGGLMGSNAGGFDGGRETGGGAGFGEGLAGQLLSYQANKPIVDRVLAEAGFTLSGNAVDTLLAGVGGESAESSRLDSDAAPGNGKLPAPSQT